MECDASNSTPFSRTRAIIASSSAAENDDADDDENDDDDDMPGAGRGEYGRASETIAAVGVPDD